MSVASRSPASSTQRLAQGFESENAHSFGFPATRGLFRAARAESLSLSGSNGRKEWIPACRRSLAFQTRSSKPSSAASLRARLDAEARYLFVMQAPADKTSRKPTRVGAAEGADQGRGVRRLGAQGGHEGYSLINTLMGICILSVRESWMRREKKKVRRLFTVPPTRSIHC